jgi:hypothetical protein
MDGVAGIFFEYFPEGQNVIVDGTRCGKNIQAPNCFQDILTGNHFPFPVG